MLGGKRRSSCGFCRWPSSVPWFYGSSGLVQESPCKTESYFSSAVLLQTVDKYSVYYMTSSILCLYTAGEFFFSFSDLTYGLVIMTVFLFFPEVFFQRTERFQFPLKRKTGDPSLWTQVLDAFEDGGSWKLLTIWRSDTLSPAWEQDRHQVSRQLLACLSSSRQIKAQKGQLPAGRNVRK